MPKAEYWKAQPAPRKKNANPKFSSMMLLLLLLCCCCCCCCCWCNMSIWQDIDIIQRHTHNNSICTIYCVATTPLELRNLGAQRGIILTTLTSNQSLSPFESGLLGPKVHPYTNTRTHTHHTPHTHTHTTPTPTPTHIHRHDTNRQTRLFQFL